MTSKAELAARAARAARLSERQPTHRPADAPADPVGESEAVKPTRMPAPRAKPVRVTTDLAPQSYRGLLAYSAGLAEDLGRAKVPHVEVIRALIAELNTNPALQETISKAVRVRLSK